MGIRYSGFSTGLGGRRAGPCGAHRTGDPGVTILKRRFPRDDNRNVGKLTVAALAFGLVLVGCSSSLPSAKARALAETCNVFKSHYGTKQVEMIATWGQKAGDAELAQEATHLQMDLKEVNAGGGVPAIIEVQKMTERCAQLGVIPQSDVH